MAAKVGYVEREPEAILQTARPSSKADGGAPDCGVEPPTRDLRGLAATLWGHYHCELTRLHGEVNLFMLEEYCYVSQELRDKQDELDAAGAYVVTKEGMKPHPLVGVTTKWSAEKRRLESELGIGTHNKKRMKRLDKGTEDAGENPITKGYDA